MNIKGVLKGKGLELVKISEVEFELDYASVRGVAMDDDGIIRRFCQLIHCKPFDIRFDIGSCTITEEVKA